MIKLEALQIVMNTDGAIPVRAACVGDVSVLNSNDKAGWVAPEKAFDLWGTRPNLPEWNALAEKAETIVCWIEADAKAIEGKFSAPVLTVAEHLRFGILPCLQPSEEPSLEACVRERGFYGSLPELGFSSTIRELKWINHDRDLPYRILGMFNVFPVIGKRLFSEDYSSDPETCCTEFPTVPGEDGLTLVIESRRYPVIATGRLILERCSGKYNVVVQITDKGAGRVNVQATRDLDPSKFFEVDPSGNLMGGGGRRNMGGKANATLLGLNLDRRINLKQLVDSL